MADLTPTLRAALLRAAELLRYGPSHADADERDRLIATLRYAADNQTRERTQ